MPFLCGLLLDEFKYRDGESWKAVKVGVPYDMVNLYDAIQWAKDYIHIGSNYYEINYHDFIIFCAGEIKKLLSMGYKPPRRA